MDLIVLVPEFTYFFQHLVLLLQMLIKHMCSVHMHVNSLIIIVGLFIELCLADWHSRLLTNNWIHTEIETLL